MIKFIILLSLLSLSLQSDKFLAPKQTLTEFPTAAITDLVIGFVRGTKILDGVPDIVSCNPLNSKIYKTATNFWNVIINVRDEKWVHSVLHLAAHSYDIYT